MANEMARTVGQQLVAPKVKGLDDFSDRDLGRQPGLLKIVYARSRNDVGSNGDLRLGEAIFPGESGVEVVILKGHHFRSLLEGPEQKPYTVCASADGRAPHDGVPNPKAQVCGDACPYGQWKDGPGGKRKPPECQQGVALLGLIAHTGDPFWLLLRKGARQIGMQLAQAIQARGTERFSDWVVKVTTIEKKNEGVVWYEPVFQILGRTPAGMYDVLSDEVVDLRYVPAISPRATTEPGPTDSGSTDTWEIPV